MNASSTQSIGGVQTSITETLAIVPNLLPDWVPQGHVGPVVLPGSGRLVWWTGRVAIGLRHQPAPRAEAFGQSALWIQDLMLQPDSTHRAAA